MRSAPTHVPAASPDGFLARLCRCREATLAGLLAAVPDREPRKYLYGPLSEHLSRTGKGLRPALCLATCGAFGGDPADAQHAAVAIEMLHNAFLVHDDIEDESELRRGQPTLHVEHGVPLAVNAGDMLNALATGMLRHNQAALGSDLSGRVLDEFEHMMRQSLEGQALELGWVRDNRCDVTEQDYLRMVLKKTCWYSFIQPCRIGALIGTRSGRDLDRFNRFGFFLGVAFQTQDDLLNLTGDVRQYGKEIGGDVLEGKRTLMLIHLFRHTDRAEARRLEALLARGRSQRTDRDVGWVLDLMRSAGSLAYASAIARRFAGAALYEFTQAFREAPDSEDKAFLEQTIRYAVGRDV